MPLKANRNPIADTRDNMFQTICFSGVIYVCKDWKNREENEFAPFGTEHYLRVIMGIHLSAGRRLNKM